jgi:hypothetical protein
VRCNDQMSFLILDEEQLQGALAVWANLPPFVASSVSDALGDLTPIPTLPLTGQHVRSG